jgi:hypothetical protein
VDARETAAAEEVDAGEIGAAGDAPLEPPSSPGQR